ncbi:MAG: hypothetical protein MK168_00840 [Candidatus Thalassarchaeum sp.]|nr:hypothetical protein [Candidatus Thalassarchaeum sp.]
MADRPLLPSPPVEEILHDREAVNIAIEEGRHSSLIICETIAALTKLGRFEELWKIADSMSKEVSVLVDAEGRVWVDIGTKSSVRLSPAQGSVIPYRLWLHTHPHEAYASQTDRGTLAGCSMILHEAIVLGHDHMVRLQRKPAGIGRSLEDYGPLSTWTSDEDIVLYSSLKEDYYDR